jgi:hypothetical protein
MFEWFTPQNKCTVPGNQATKIEKLFIKERNLVGSSTIMNWFSVLDDRPVAIYLQTSVSLNHPKIKP